MSWLIAFAGFALLVILHEFGHFIAAKKTGMRVERFFLFFPPKLWSFKRGETEYGIGMIPLGGFVKITGMNPDELEAAEAAAATGSAERARPGQLAYETADPDDHTPAGLLNRIEASGQGPEPLTPDVLERAYYNQPVWKRIVVIAAGPAMNLLIAFVILFALAFGAEEISGPGLKIAELTTESPAKGIVKDDDQVVSIDGKTLTGLDGDKRADAFREEIGSHTCAGEPTEGCDATTPVKIVVDRDGQQIPLEVTPKYDPGAEQALIGVRFQPTDITDVNPSVGEAAGRSLDTMWTVTTKTASVFSQIFNAEQRKQLSGVVGGYEATRQAVDLDWRLALGILGVISFSLALINLFPFLPLDGGHIFWSIVEKVRGRPVSFATMEKSSAFGILLILMIGAIGLTNDLGRIFSGEGFGIR